MKLLPFLLLAPALAHASWFNFEAGVGIAHSNDMGDGIWTQRGVPNNHEKLNAPAFVLGITGNLAPHLDWHADYIYAGTTTARCTCTADDANYNPRTHQVVGNPTRWGQFSGQGHNQGFALTLEPNYTYRNVRFGVEAGPWIYWNTWHETAIADYGTVNASHKTVAQIGAVAGASIGYKDFSLKYRYFYQKQQWNPYPGLVTSTHMLTIEKKF